MDKLHKRLCIAVTALVMMPGAALACGVCIDDKVAAVYDHEVMKQAISTHRQVMFCELAGPFDTASLAARARKAAQALPDIDRHSVRTVDHMPMLSFVVDPARQSTGSVFNALRQRLAMEGISAKLLKTLPEAAERKPE